MMDLKDKWSLWAFSGMHIFKDFKIMLLAWDRERLPIKDETIWHLKRENSLKSPLVFSNFLLFFWCEVIFNIECLANLLLQKIEKPGPQLGLPVIEELWLCLQKCREEIYCQPLEAFAIKTRCIAQFMPGASSLDIKVKILATTGFVF
jgi:hypothetical protein